jgi:hypothetical protein
LGVFVCSDVSDGLRLIVGKYIVVDCVGENAVVCFSDEVPENHKAENSDIICFSTRVFIAGDMAFLLRFSEKKT